MQAVSLGNTGLGDNGGVASELYRFAALYLCRSRPGDVTLMFESRLQ